MLDSIILNIGKPAFADALFEAFRDRLRARQVVLYDFDADTNATTLAARDDRPDGCVHGLVHDYLVDYIVDDPIRARYAPAPVRSIEQQSFVATHDVPTDYVQRLFVGPGIASKLSLIVRDPAGSLCLTVYRDRCVGAFDADDRAFFDNLEAPLAAAIERHAELCGRASRTRTIADDATPTRDAIAARLRRGEGMPSLAPREAQVCARIVCGYSNEAIGLDLGLSFHSVRTYRRRAYAKLGIASQNELFALVLQDGAARTIRH